MKYRLLSWLGLVVHAVFAPLGTAFATLMAYGQVQRLRLAGHHIGHGVKIGHNTRIQIVGRGRLTTGAGTYIGANSLVVVQDAGA